MTHPADKSAVVLNSSSNLYHWSMFRLIVVASCRDQTRSIQCQYLIQVNYRAQLKMAGYNLNCSTFPLLEGFYGPHFIAMVCQTHNIMSCSCALVLFLGLAIDGGQGKNQDVIQIIKQKGKVAALQNLILGMFVHCYCGEFFGEGQTYMIMTYYSKYVNTLVPS